MSLDLLKKRLKENKLCTTYLFYGKEEYTKDYYARELRKRVTSSPLPEFNYIIFDAENSKPDELGEAAFSMPYLCDYKLIEVKNFDPSSLTADDAQIYAKVISELPEYVMLLFLFRSAELDDGLVEGTFSVPAVKASAETESNDDSGENRTATKGQNKGVKILIDAIKKHGLAVGFPNETGEKLDNWIKKHFAAHKTECDNGAVQTLISLCGNDMYTLHSEIQKLVCSPAQRPISQDAVLEYCCANESYKVYELSDALTNGDLKKVKQIFGNLAANKTDPSMLLGYLSKCYSDMLIIQAAIDEGKGISAAAKILKKSEWLVRRSASGLSKKPQGYIEFACDVIDATDRKLKRYSVDSYSLLEIMLFKIGLYGKQ